MNTRKVMIYIYIAYGWSFTCWIAGFIIAQKAEEIVIFNADLANALMNKDINPQLILPIVITIAAVYGPMIGAKIVKSLYKEPRATEEKSQAKLMTVVNAIGLVTFISIVPGLFFIGSIDFGLDLKSIGWFVLMFFIYQFLTSGMEEIGWRGYLFPEFRRSHSLWQSSVRVGLIWGFWHTPVVIYIFWAQGLTVPQMVMSFAGFIAGTIGMSVIHGYFYEQSRSVWLSVLIHALSNTLPFVIGLLTKEAYMIAVLSQFILWAVVIILTKVKKEEFHQLNERNSPVEVG